MKENGEVRTIREETVVYRGLCLQYQLLQDAKKGGYSLAVTLGKEQVSVALGEDFSFAGDCYRLARDGGVTPCTLADVVEDLRLEKGIFAKPIYKLP